MPNLAVKCRLIRNQHSFRGIKNRGIKSPPLIACYLVKRLDCNLSLREREKGLSTGERKMLDIARQILISELVLAKEEKEDSIKLLIDDLFA